MHTIPHASSSPTSRQNTRRRDAEHTLRWVLAHEPPVVFEEASREFTRVLRELSDGDLAAELMMADDFAAARGQEFVSRRELVESLQRGDIEMAHCYVAALGAFHEPLWAIELPFLFTDYEHAERVFEGPHARQLMDDMRPLGMRGVAFAYSGGYRIVPTQGRALRTIEDFAGFQLRTSGNPVPEAMYKALGATAIGADLESIAPMTRAGQISGCEITYVRFKATGLDQVFDVVNETSHSLFTTMTVVNERWFQSLSDKHQTAVMEAGEVACRVERKTAINEEAKTRADYGAAGLSQVRSAIARGSLTKTCRVALESAVAWKRPDAVFTAMEHARTARVAYVRGSASAT